MWLGVMTLIYSSFCAPFTQAMLRLHPEMKADGKLVLLSQILRSRMATIGSILAGALLLIGLVYSTIAANYFFEFACIACLVIIECIRGFGIAVLSAQRQQKLFSLLTSLDIICRQGAMVASAMLFGASVGALLMGNVFGAALVASILWLRSRGVARHDGTAAERASLSKEITAFSRPLMPIAISGWFSGVADRYIVAAFAGAGAAGIYSAAYGFDQPQTVSDDWDSYGTSISAGLLSGCSCKRRGQGAPNNGCVARNKCFCRPLMFNGDLGMARRHSSTVARQVLSKRR